MATITSTYNGWLTQHLLTMDAYHNICLLWTVAIASTYNERLPWHLLTIDAYHNSFLQWKVTI